MLGKRALEDLKKAKQRRARRPVLPARLSASGGVERRMAKHHIDVLQNIECMLVDAYRRSDEVDDRVVAAALRAAISGDSSDEPVVDDMLTRLCATRKMRADISDELWTDGLRVVLKSVRRHSKCQHGDTEYLDFVDAYLP